MSNFQDPYIRLTLHDGQLDQGKHHVGESVRTTTKNNSGGQANFDELFMLNKPGNWRIDTRAFPKEKQINENVSEQS